MVYCLKEDFYSENGSTRWVLSRSTLSYLRRMPWWVRISGMFDLVLAIEKSLEQVQPE